MLCLIPIALFMQVLRQESCDREVFLAVHETLAVTVLGLVVFRLAWLAHSSPPPLSPSLRPWERRLARAVHLALYALILSLPLTGILLTVFGGEAVNFYGLTLTLPVKAKTGAPWETLHNQVPPGLFYAIIPMHLSGVLRHHFISRRKEDVRRMLR